MRRREEPRARLAVVRLATFVIEDDDQQAVAFASVGPERSQHDPAFPGEVYAIYVLAAQQQKGLGRRLVTAAAQALAAAGAHGMLG